MDYKSVIADEEIASRVEAVEKLKGILDTAGSFGFKRRRQLIELLNIEIVLGVSGGRKFVDVLWYGDTERIWIDSEIRS